MKTKLNLQKIFEEFKRNGEIDLAQFVDASKLMKILPKELLRAVEWLVLTDTASIIGTSLVKNETIAEVMERHERNMDEATGISDYSTGAPIPWEPKIERTDKGLVFNQTNLTPEDIWIKKWPRPEEIKPSELMKKKEENPASKLKEEDPADQLKNKEESWKILPSKKTIDVTKGNEEEYDMDNLPKIEGSREYVPVSWEEYPLSTDFYVNLDEIENRVRELNWGGELKPLYKIACLLIFRGVWIPNNVTGLINFISQISVVFSSIPLKKGEELDINLAIKAGERVSYWHDINEDIQTNWKEWLSSAYSMLTEKWLAS